MNKNATIIPIASGKGGVGKSMFAANLAIALAKMGHLTVAVDLDFGGSNLYTYLGISNIHPGIGNYLKTKDFKFNDLMVQTSILNLKFIPGDGKFPFISNISEEQRIDLNRHIRQIPAKYIILDIGAGSMFNSLSFYGLAHRGIIISSFEIPSIMNFITFLRSFMFRVLCGIVHKNKEVLNIITSTITSSVEPALLTIKYFLEIIEKYDSVLSKRAYEICNKYKPHIIFNMGDNPSDLTVLNKIDTTLKNILSMKAVFLGCIFYDKCVRNSSKNGDLLFEKYPDSIASKEIQNIAERINEIYNNNFNYDTFNLFEDTQKRYKERG